MRPFCHFCHLYHSDWVRKALRERGTDLPQLVKHLADRAVMSNRGICLAA
jgi:hypothetical protein